MTTTTTKEKHDEWVIITVPLVPDATVPLVRYYILYPLLSRSLYTGPVYMFNMNMI